MTNPQNVDEILKNLAYEASGSDDRDVYILQRKMERGLVKQHIAALRQLIEEKLPKEKGEADLYDWDNLGERVGYDQALADVKRALKAVFEDEK